MWLDFSLSFETFRIICRNIWHGSQSSIYVSRVKIAENTVFFCFISRFFFEFWAKNFQTFGQKTSKSFQNYLRVQRNSLWLDFFFLKFWIVLDFLQKPSAWFSKFCLRVQSKNCGRNSFLIFRFRFFFGLWVKSFSDFRPKNFKKLTKLTSARPEEHFVTLTFFKKNWTLLDFLQKPLVWFSNLYLKAQSKICGRNSFFLFSFSEVFRILSKLFSDFWPKNFEKLSKLPSTCPEEHFVAWFFFKFWNVSDYLQKHLAWFSKFYLRVQSKNCGKHCFFCFLSRFFSNFEQKIFRLLAKKLRKVFKTTYVSRGIVCGLKFFPKVLNRFGCSAETFGMVLKILSTCPE